MCIKNTYGIGFSFQKFSDSINSMNKLYIFGFVAALALVGILVFLGQAQPTQNPMVTLRTSKGDIVIELFVDKTPITAGNFVKLVREGFYNGTKFHRVIAGFMIQGGDPSSKGDDSSVYGTGGPGYTIQDEFVEELSNVRGTISMANIGQPNSGGSQFFINLGDNTGLDFNKEPLTSKHPVFGKVAEGMDVVDAIAQVDTDSRDVPVDPLIISEIIVDEK